MLAYQFSWTGYHGDRLEENRTNWNGSFATKSDLGGRRFCREGQALFGRADHRDSEVGRPGYTHPGTVSDTRVSEQSYYRWKKIYGDMEPSETRELKQLREENVKLKRLVADLSLDKAMLQNVLQKNSEACQETRDG